MPLFTYYPTPGFTTKMAKIEKYDPPGYTRILSDTEAHPQADVAGL